MGERTTYPPGTFCWTDLATTDPEGAKAFYTGLFGWEVEDMPTDEEGGVYTMARLEGKYVAALYRLQMPGVPPAWGSHVWVDDADAAAARLKALGGTLMAEPFDVLDAGRMAVAQDPQGAVFLLWQPGRHRGAELVNVPGALTLNQLNTSDPEAAGRFYSDLFGWTVEVQDTGDGPGYWGLFNQGALNGGMMELPAEGQAPPHWLVYFASDDLDRAGTRIGELGGDVVVGPMSAGEEGTILVARDPQGAYFALFAGRLDP